MALPTREENSPFVPLNTPVSLLAFLPRVGQAKFPVKQGIFFNLLKMPGLDWNKVERMRPKNICQILGTIRLVRSSLIIN